MIEGDYEECVAAVIHEIHPFYPPLVTRANYPARLGRGGEGILMAYVWIALMVVARP